MAFGDALRGKQETVAQCKNSSHCRDFNLGSLGRGPVHAGSPAQKKDFLSHRTHSRTAHASTVRPEPWDALFYGNCRERPGAITRSEWGAKACEPGF
jgi:hypothetical protein